MADEEPSSSSDENEDLGDSQPPTQDSSQKTKKNFKLKNGVSMKVTGCGPVDQTGDIKLKMEWTVPNRKIKDKEIVIPWDDSTIKKARGWIWKKLLGPILLESKNQVRDFPIFLENEIDAFEAEKSAIGNAHAFKPIQVFETVEVLDQEGKLYLVAGAKQIFLLGEAAGNEWARLLTEEEIKSLPVDILWEGDEYHFEADSKRATELILKMINNMNQCQDTDWYSYGLFHLCGVIGGFLYKQKLKYVNNCMTYLTISGEGYSTGKSLWSDAGMYALYGRKLDCSAPTTIPSLFEMLTGSTPIHVREWTDSMWKILIEAVPAIWEANGRMGKIPSTTMFASGNITAAELDKRVKGPIRSKMAVLFTGENSMENEHVTEYCNELIQASKALFQVLPSVIGLGTMAMLQEVPSEVVQSYSGELRKKGDKRESQLLYEYDCVYKILFDKAKQCELELPPLMLKTYVDHGAVTGLNKNGEDVRQNLQMVLQYIDSADLYDLLVPASRDSTGQGGFKVASNDPRLPSDIRTALNKCTETFITTVNKKAVRLRFLDTRDLDRAVVKQLHEKVSESKNTYEKRAQRAIAKSARDQKSLARQFKTSFTLMRLPRMTAKEPNSILSPKALVGIGSPSQSAPSQSAPSQSAPSQSAPVVDHLEQSVTTDKPVAGTSKTASSCSQGDSEIQARTCLTPGCPSKDKVFGSIKYLRSHEKTVSHQQALENMDLGLLPVKRRKGK